MTPPKEQNALEHVSNLTSRLKMVSIKWFVAEGGELEYMLEEHVYLAARVVPLKVLLLLVCGISLWLLLVTLLPCT